METRTGLAKQVELGVDMQHAEVAMLKTNENYEANRTMNGQTSFSILFARESEVFQHHL